MCSFKEFGGVSSFSFTLGYRSKPRGDQYLDFRVKITGRYGCASTDLFGKNIGFDASPTGEQVVIADAK